MRTGLSDTVDDMVIDSSILVWWYREEKAYHLAFQSVSVEGSKKGPAVGSFWNVSENGEMDAVWAHFKYPPSGTFSGTC